MLGCCYFGGKLIPAQRILESWREEGWDTFPDIKVSFMQFNKSRSQQYQNENSQSEFINYKLRGENGQDHTFNAVWRNLITLIAFFDEICFDYFVSLWLEKGEKRSFPT